MGKFKIESKYIATITHVVDAENEGEALDLARNMAEDADINEFTICEEQESRILNQY